MLEDRKHVVLIGMPGSGKSTVGRALSSLLGLAFRDSDQWIVEQSGVTISTIFDVEGEVGFRRREIAALSSIAEGEPAVIATGGGAVMFDANRRLLQKVGHIVYLRTSIDLLVERTSRDRARPLLQQPDLKSKLDELLRQRAPIYEELAELTVDSNRRSAGKLARDIAIALGKTAPDQASISGMVDEMKGERLS